MCLAVLFAIRAQVFALQLSSSISTLAGRTTIIVRYCQGREAWAANTLQETAMYIPKVERYLGAPIWGEGRIIINGCEDCGARLENGEVYLPYSSSDIGQPSVLFHEINHYWFGYQSSPICLEWLEEGIASYIPLAMMKKGLLPDIPAYHEQIERWWGLWSILDRTLPDVPLCPFNENKRNRLYGKSFKLQHLIYTVLGPRRYQRFLRYFYREQPRGNHGAIDLLQRFQRRNWRRFLTGWVLGDTYRKISMSEVTVDSDGDRLSRAEERLLGLSDLEPDQDQDLLPDGAEYSLGRNPRQADPDAPSLISRHGPFIDGNSSDWFLFSSQGAIDEAEDQTGPAWSDMLEMHFFIRDEVLYLLITTGDSPQVPQAVFFDILVDTDFDYYTDHEFAFMLESPRWPWHYNYASESTDYPLALYAGLGRHIEMAIPLSEISSSSFQILPVIYDYELSQGYDWWKEWVLVH